ncbi:DNA-binding domain-containing protein [Notoacmeibacter sp. MSK16QG-6]|uniref:HvfC/BufC N-terminal domain-containing protein n=1 Tax=Notoacmeibacter sp. MSK16QG-6 TaxID=2957982 RepID=UPI0021114BED|nr:DNA-binding domain-containing protein [Notoacmeibacter sp. MSK16QG-6]MCP1198087.1 putative DNA-binding domain-containing protein [Notoacmeibacter sp. MSK16QG-6]
MTQAAQTTCAETEFLACLPAESQVIPADMKTADGRADGRRFAIYRNNLRSSLSRALEQRYPVTRRLVGDEFFAFVTAQFTVQHRPTSPLMFRYGEAFPSFLGRIESAGHLAYLPEVARLEWLLGESYHAADASVLQIADLQSLDLSDVDAISKIAMHPAGRLLSSSHPVGSIWVAHQSENVKPLTKGGAEQVLLTRPEETVLLTLLSEAEMVFASAMSGGKTLEDAAMLAFDTDASFDFGATLLRLTEAGALTQNS